MWLLPGLDVSHYNVLIIQKYELESHKSRQLYTNHEFVIESLQYTEVNDKVI